MPPKGAGTSMPAAPHRLRPRASAQSTAFYVWAHEHRYQAVVPEDVWAAASDWGAADALLRSGRLDNYVARLEQLIDRLEYEPGADAWEVLSANAWLAEIRPLASELLAVLRADQIASQEAF
jgi:hypothetical protein